MTPDQSALVELIAWARKASKCIYIAVEQAVADDISGGLTKLADALERLSSEDGVTEAEVERWKAKCLAVATERDRLAEHREQLIEELAMLKARKAP